MHTSHGTLKTTVKKKSVWRMEAIFRVGSMVTQASNDDILLTGNQLMKQTQQECDKILHGWEPISLS